MRFFSQGLSQLNCISIFHPSAQKLYNPVHRSRPADTSTDTLKLLEEVASHCATCQTFGARPLRFLVSLPDEKLDFNEELRIIILIN